MQSTIRKIDNMMNYGSTRDRGVGGPLLTPDPDNPGNTFTFDNTTATRRGGEGTVVAKRKSLPKLFLHVTQASGQRALDVIDILGEWLAEFFFTQPKMWYDVDATTSTVGERTTLKEGEGSGGDVSRIGQIRESSSNMTESLVDG